MTTTIVVLAAGMSSRMKKSVDSNIDDSKATEANNKSKSLITFGNKPFIYFLLKNIIDAGFETVIMVFGKDFQDFKNQIDELIKKAGITQNIQNNNFFKRIKIETSN